MTDHTAREVAARAYSTQVTPDVPWENLHPLTQEQYRHGAQDALDAIGYEEAAAIVRELGEWHREFMASADGGWLSVESQVEFARRAHAWVSHHPAAESVSVMMEPLVDGPALDAATTVEEVQAATNFTDEE